MVYCPQMVWECVCAGMLGGGGGGYGQNKIEVCTMLTPPSRHTASHRTRTDYYVRSTLLYVHRNRTGRWAHDGQLGYFQFHTVPELITTWLFAKYRRHMTYVQNGRQTGGTLCKLLFLRSGPAIKWLIILAPKNLVGVRTEIEARFP